MLQGRTVPISGRPFTRHPCSALIESNIVKPNTLLPGNQASFRGFETIQTPDTKVLLPRKELVKNSVINLSGFVLPLAVGLITIPLIIRGFGVERFGFLTLAWAIIGYFSLFDLGIGRAITQLVSEKIGHRAPEKEVTSLAWTGLLLMSIFALIGTLITVCLAPWFIVSVLNVSENLKEEAIWAIVTLAAAIPAVVLSSGFAGILTAIHRFDLINALRIPMGVMIFLVPVGILPYSKSLTTVCFGLMIIRFLFLFLHMATCLYAFPQMRANICIHRPAIGRLLGFGSWMTISNVIGPLMVYVDRFVIGSLLSVAMVAYYVTPYEMVTRLLALPAAIVAVLFPAFASSKGNAMEHAVALYSNGRTHHSSNPGTHRFSFSGFFKRGAVHLAWQ